MVALRAYSKAVGDTVGTDAPLCSALRAHFWLKWGGTSSIKAGMDVEKSLYPGSFLV